MGGKDQMRDSRKRMRPAPAAPKGAERNDLKRPKHGEPKVSKFLQEKKIKPSGGKPPFKFNKKMAASVPERQVPMTKRELRLDAKEKAEARKKRRKPHYNLEKDLASLWEKFRVRTGRTMAAQDRSKLVTEALEKMRGKIHEIATSHVSSRILQTCLKFCSQVERDAVFEELRPHLLTLSSNAYSVHLVKKILDNANKSQLEWFISSLHGNVSSLLRQMVGSIVVEHAFQLANGSQKCQLLMELYSTEFQLFKDLTIGTGGRLVDIICKLGLQKSSVVKHMTSVIQPILEKGIVDHSIIHTVLMEYLSIADRYSAMDVIQQLSGSLLVRMIHTRNGSKVGVLCIKHGSAKERKKIIKEMKGRVDKIARDQYCGLVLVSILSHVDDTKLLRKIIIHELQANLKDLLLDKNARRPLLQLLHPHCQSYFSQDDLVSLSSSIPSFCSQDDTSGLIDDASELINVSSLEKKMESSDNHENGCRNYTAAVSLEGDAKSTDSEKNLCSTESGKKDPAVRRDELLNSGLAENLVDTCIENVEQLLFSPFGKDVIYEVAMGGVDAIFSPSLSEKVKKLHEAIASLGAVAKVDDSKEEHVFVNFHTSRIIRKLILSCPAFATTLWNLVLKGQCETWAQGHSLKVVSAYVESSDSDVRNLAKEELQPLFDKGTFKVLKTPSAKTTLPTSS